ncbi:uncharacterized protein LOC105645689 [Jatropha curcas]|uniref:uncharacterized protein LOC105645689 n=1 Tax=Jatropha curcas TaxID=180498 RepID=UPI0005FA99F1|nr:uncharacterized protein LOC105645689 [Jatropha curcas]
MASVQCYKPAQQTCNNQGHQNHSFGHKMSEMVGSSFKKDHTPQCQTQRPVTKTQTHTHCSSQTAFHGQTAQGHATGNVTNCHGKTRRNNGERRNRGLLQKIKDGISGHSDSDSDSCSSSDSESDGEKCGRKRN